MAKAKKAKAKTRKARKSNGHAAPDRFGFRAGSLKSKAAAMYASRNGATLAQVKSALKSSQFNLLKELEERELKIKRTLVRGEGPRKVTRYKIVTR